jgi:phage-related protein
MPSRRAITVEILGNAKGLMGAFKDAEGAGKRFGNSMNGLKGVVATLGLGAIGAEAFSFGKGALQAAEESRKVQKGIEATIKATGGAAGVTAKQIDAFASSMQMKTGIDDEAIKTSQGLLLGFKSVKNEAGKGNNIFDRASVAMVDLGKKMGSTDSAAKALGKALTDPIGGIRGLKAAGVTLSDAQKDQVKAFMAAGDTLSAQKIILGEVEGRVGGFAEKTASAGDKMKVAFEEVKEKVGGALLPIFDKVAQVITNKLIPAVESFFKENGPKIKKTFEDIKAKIEPVARVIGHTLVEAFKKVGDFAAKNKPVVAAFIGVLVAAAAIAGIVALAGAIAALFNPITLIVIGIAALVAGFVYLYNHFEVVRQAVQILKDAFVAYFKIIVAEVKLAIQIILDVVNFFVGMFKAIWNTFGDAIVTYFKGIWEEVAGVFRLFVAVFTGNWTAAWNALVSIFGGVKDQIIGVFEGIWAVVRGILNLMIGGAETMVNAYIKSLNLIIRGLNIINPFKDIPRIPEAHLPRLAKGGIVTGPTTALIGEAGPEAVIPLSRAGAFGGGSTVNINVQVSPLSNPAEVGQAVVSALKAYERRSGPLPLRVA